MRERDSYRAEVSEAQKLQISYEDLVIILEHHKEDLVKLSKKLAFTRNINVRSKNNNTILHWAVAKKVDPMLVEELLKNGSNPNVADNNGNTALIQAVKNGDQATVSMLLLGGALVNKKK